MEDTAVPQSRTLLRLPGIPTIDVLRITAGLSCDGDTIAMIAATNTSIEDLVLGGIPGIPKITLHNQVLAYTVGADFLRPFEHAAEGETRSVHPGGRGIDSQRAQ
jgi:hydrogenase small subunit